MGPWRSTLVVMALVFAVAPGVAAANSEPVLELDPVMDAAVLSGSVGMGVMLELIIGTGEISPQEPGDPSKLLAIDRWRAEQGDFPDDGIRSNLGLGLMLGYAVVDSVLVDALGRGDPWYHYAMVYAQTLSVTLAVTNLFKIAVRRPRPEAYAAARQNGEAGPDTNTALSFFSGHAAAAGGLAATAAYLAFARTDSRGWEPWLVLLLGVGLTAVVSEARVNEGKHFPTDVIAGVMAGASVGMGVTHLHRADETGQARANLRWQLTPTPRNQGAMLQIGGTL